MLINCFRFLISVTFFTCSPFVLASARANGELVFPSPYLNDRREIQIVTPREVIPVRSPLPIQVLVFKDAQKACLLNERKLDETFKNLLKDGSPIYRALDLIFDGPASAIADLSITILIEDLGAGRRDFNSIYLPKVPGAGGPVIVLDCSIAAQAFWLPSLAHELVHALSRRFNMDSWFEEGMAQLIETEMGGVQPEHELDIFRSTRAIPSLTELNRPLPSHESYAFSYLFAKYVQSRLGGWKTLSAMGGIDVIDPECSLDNATFFEKAMCRAKRFLSQSPDLSYLSEKMTPAGITRLFSVALTLNDSAFPLYSIPGWHGFTNLRPVTSIQPYSFTILDQPPQPSIDDRVEAYGVSGQGLNFRILPLRPNEVLQPDSFALQRKILLINPTRSEIALFPSVP